MISFYMDNIEVSNPVNWQELESIVRNDQEIGGVLVYEESNLTWADSAYEYLVERANDGFCNTIDLVVKDDASGTLQDIITAKIFVADIEFNERDCTASVKIQDKSYFAMINNNRSARVSIETTLTKNQQVMTPPAVYNLDVYSQANVIYLNNCRAYRIYDVMKAVIDYVSDNRIGFASTLFEVGGEFEGLCITSGYNLRTGGNQEFPQFSFEDIMKELNALMPVAFQIEDPYVSPVFRLELRSYFQQSDTVLTIDDIAEIRRKFDRTRLFTSVRIGSTVTDSDVTLNFPESIKFLGFAEETYNILGECNINRTLELSGNWIRSNNILQRIITVDQSYDENIILFDSTLTDATNGRTTNTNFLNLSPAIFFWNERLTNNQIADRYESWIPNSIAQNYGAVGDGLFRAHVASTINVPTGTYLNTSLNTTDVWQNPASYFDGTDTYTALQAGVFDFQFYLEFANIVITPPGGGGIVVWSLGSSIRQFDSAGTLLRTITLTNPSYGNDPSDKILNVTRRVVMNQGDYIQWQVTKLEGTGTDVTGDITTNTFWRCEENTVGGGIFKDYDPQDYPVNLYDFDVPLTCSQWQSIIANPKGLFKFKSTGNYRSAYLREIKYNHVRGVASFSLIKDSNAD